METHRGRTTTTTTTTTCRSSSCSSSRPSLFTLLIIVPAMLLALHAFALTSLAVAPTVHVVAYTNIRGYLNWHLPWFVDYAAQGNCTSGVHCVFSEDSSKASSAEVVLYLASSINQLHKEFPSSKDNLNIRKKQIYAMISMEQPKYAPVLTRTRYLQNNFDVLMTYDMDSSYLDTHVDNIPLSYYPLNIVSMEAIMQPPRPFRDKFGITPDIDSDVLVATFVSNCDQAGATERLAYLRELMTLVKVHSFGLCLHNKDEPSSTIATNINGRPGEVVVDVHIKDKRWPDAAHRRARKIRLLSRYKFYLAFENAHVKDYVSEKVFEGLISGALTVYRGAAEIEKFLPENSFINANSMSPSELAKLIKELAADESKYNRYFEFKSKPMPEHFERVASMSYTHPNALCRLCDYYVKRMGLN